MNNEQVLEKLSNDFPGHKFELRKGICFIDGLRVGDTLKYVRDIPLYYHEFLDETEMKNALYADIYSHVQLELELRGV